MEESDAQYADSFTCLTCVDEVNRCPTGYTKTDSIFVNIGINGAAYFDVPEDITDYYARGYVTTSCLTYIGMEETWIAWETGKRKSWTSTDPNCHLVYGAVTLGCEKSN